MDEQTMFLDWLKLEILGVRKDVTETNKTVSEIKTEQAVHGEKLNNIDDRLKTLEAAKDQPNKLNFQLLLTPKVLAFGGIALIALILALNGIDISPIVAKLIPLF